MAAEHKCFKETNAALAEHNTKLVQNILNPNHLVIATDTIEKKRGQRAKVVIASYCPFCGKALK
jgi:hypothetical protein